MLYAVKSIHQYLGDGHGKPMLYDNIKDASQAAKDYAEGIRFVMSDYNNKPYELDITTECFGGDPDLEVPRIIINKLDSLGRKCSMDQVTVVNGQIALRDIKNCEDIQYQAQRAIEKLNKFIAENK